MRTLLFVLQFTLFFLFLAENCFNSFLETYIFSKRSIGANTPFSLMMTRDDGPKFAANARGAKCGGLSKSILFYMIIQLFEARALWKAYIIRHDLNATQIRIF